jgi:hypothetical protein
VPAVAIVATWPQPRALWYAARVRFASPQGQIALLQELNWGNERWKILARREIFRVPPGSVAITGTAIVRGRIIEASFALTNVGRRTLHVFDPVITIEAGELVSIHNYGRGAYSLRPGESTTVQEQVPVEDPSAPRCAWAAWIGPNDLGIEPFGTKFVLFPRGKPPDILDPAHEDYDPSVIGVALAPEDGD